MIPHGVEIFVGLETIDLRWSFDRLAGIVEERIGRDARSGAMFVFFGKRRCAIKVLFADMSGLCLFYKRLDKGTFRLPPPMDEHSKTVSIDEHVLEALLDGLDIETQRVSARPRVRVH
jgi:transposase